MVNNSMAQTRELFAPSKLAAVAHPGEILEEKLQEMKMGVKEFATRVSKPEKTIIAVLTGRSSITPDMALAFEMETTIRAHMWLRHQKSYDEFVARKRRILKRVCFGPVSFPVEEMSDLG